jgi:hypothetical protein
MTMIDEQVLSDWMHDAADSIDLPEGAVERILEASQVVVLEGRAPRPGRRPSFGRSDARSDGRSRRWVLAPVAVALVGALIGISVASSHPTSSSGPMASSSAGPAVHGTTSGPAIYAPSNGADRAPTNLGGSAGAPASGPTPSSNSVPSLPSGSVGQSAKVESTGTIDLTIGNGKLQSVLNSLTYLAVGAGGFVANTQAQVGAGATGTPSSGSIVLRVPEASFARIVAQVQRDGHATSVNTTSTDVTGQYVDLQARIAALQASRQQYLNIMAQATSIGDILSVQSQLDTLQSQIEQLQGQLSVLDNETTYGSLTVTLSESGRRPTPPVPPRAGLDKAWDDGIGGFVSGFEWLIRIGGTTLFVLLCLGVLLVLGRWVWRTARRQML